MTEIANPTLGKVEDIIEQFGLHALMGAGLAALFAWAPALAWGGIIRKLAETLADKLFEFLRLIIDLKAIRFVNEKHQAEFERSVVKLRILEREKGLTSDEFLKERENAKARFAQLVRFHGA